VLFASRGESAVRRPPQGWLRISSRAALRCVKRKCKRKYGAVPALAGYADGATVSFDDGFRNRQSHASTLHEIALILAAIKFVKDQPEFDVLDSRPVIRNAGRKKIPAGFSRDGNRLVLRGVSIGVFDQADKNIFYTIKISKHM